ncbi:MAG: radical SAM protein [Deltaproteobacteria bacterium HGW-Deltaproteobacteria-1]|nr:MAG: radical SAM protein [Deltaproteobacteria bacterium HGW-Deltaproteobacteria-1]
MIFIHPPVAKPSEPPAGIARLSACLKGNRVAHQVIDANLEGMLDLMRSAAKNGDLRSHWDIRSFKNLEDNLRALQTIGTFRNKSRYTRAVVDLNHTLNAAGQPYGAMLSLSDYAEKKLSPVKSGDLIAAAENPESNPFYPYFSKRLRQALEEVPAYIGFSLNFLSQAICTMAMIGFIKKQHPGQKIILGGSLITSWAQITGRSDFFSGLVDEIVAGAGEEKLLDLLCVHNIQRNGYTDYSLSTENQYLSPGFILPYSSARGCWWRKCAFCPEATEGNPYLPLPPIRAADELRTITEKTRPSLIHVLDSSIAPVRLQAMANQPPGAPWYGFAHVTEHLTDADFCRALKEAGCVMLKLGIESGDQSVLDRLNKGINLKTVSTALRAIAGAGIATYCYFLFGTPQENEASAVKTLDFVTRHTDCINYLNLAVFNLPAGSPETQTLATSDFYEGDLSLYKSFQHPGGWQRTDVRNFLQKTFKKHPAIATILTRTPEFFTSNHAPFFTFQKK